MVEVVRATSAGFCFGVERILKMSDALLGKDSEHVYCLGELIHNPGEVQRIKDEGMKFIHDPNDLPDLPAGSKGWVLIRAHGVSPKVKDAVRARGYEVHDGTCPLVTIPHNFARKIVEDGYRLIIMGHDDHPEIKGILGEVEDLEGQVDIVADVPGLDDINLRASDRVGMICQTTHPHEKYSELIGAVLERTLEVRAYNTICQATFDRQDAIRELAQEVDLAVVIGGRQSSNTARLVEIASEYITCYHVEDSSELRPEWFVGVKRVGISAGASTPENAIQQVSETIRTLVGD